MKRSVWYFDLRLQPNNIYLFVCLGSASTNYSNFSLVRKLWIILVNRCNYGFKKQFSSKDACCAMNLMLIPSGLSCNENSWHLIVEFSKRKILHQIFNIMRVRWLRFPNIIKFKTINKKWILNNFILNCL